MTSPGSEGGLTQIKHYRFVREVGRGGMGAVFEAVDGHDGSRVAVKLLHPWLVAEDATFRDRFEREAHIAALLRSPYTVRLVDFGVTDNTYFLVMEFVEGGSLTDEIAKGPLDPIVAFRVAIDVARAMEEAGARGVVHRDIKPANILLTTDGRVKVTDFGIARHEGGAGLTSSGGFVGTAEYAAPEQMSGESDHRSDIYALGATLYCMLTGHPPFRGTNLWDVLRQHQSAPLPTAPLAHLPDAVVNPIRRCMEKDPRDRYQTASELAAALERALAAYVQLRDSPAPPPSSGRPAAPSPSPAPPLPVTEPVATAPVAPPAAAATRVGAPGGLPPPAAPAGGATRVVAQPPRGGPPPPRAWAPPPLPTPWAPPASRAGRAKGGGVRTWLIVGGVSGAIAVAAFVAILTLVGGDDDKQPAQPGGEVPGGGASPGATAPVKLNDVIVARTVPAGSDTDLGTYQPAIDVYEPLVRRGGAALAESWLFTAPNTWTFTLKQGVLFHDGSPFTSADVVTSFDKLAQSATNAIGARTGATTAVDPLTVRFVTSSTAGQELLNQFDSALIRKATADAAAKPIGTGPFKFVDYQKNTRLVVERWDKYRTATRVNSRSITFRYLADAAARAEELLAGKVDLVVGVDPGSTGKLTAAGMIVETCGQVTVAHTPKVTGGCSSTGLSYERLAKE